MSGRGNSAVGLLPGMVDELAAFGSPSAYYSDSDAGGSDATEAYAAPTMLESSGEALPSPCVQGSRTLSLRKSLVKSVLRMMYNPHSNELHTHYRLGAKLGQGKFGTVYVARMRARSHAYAKQVVGKTGEATAEALAAAKVEGRKRASVTLNEQRRANACARYYLNNRVEWPLACKVMSKNTDDNRDQQRVLSDLNRELYLLDQCQHEYVVHLVEKFETSKHFYVMLGRCYGDVATFQADYTATQTYLPLDLCQKWAFQLCSGLAHVHECGVVHRDVKRTNLMLSTRGQQPDVVLGDFGFACRVDEDQWLRGTPLMMPPEVMLGRAQLAPGDNWAAGVTLFEIVTNGHPFKNAKARDIVELLVEADEPHGHPRRTKAAAKPSELSLQRKQFRSVALQFHSSDVYVASFEELATAVVRDEVPVEVTGRGWDRSPLAELVRRLLCRSELGRATAAEAVALECFDLLRATSLFD